MNKTIIFLGSSVTYGAAAGGISFVDLLEQKKEGYHCIKEAVSGTTLVDDEEHSYISRMKRLSVEKKADLFVCQLSTNDATQGKPFGKVSDQWERELFDTHTIAGAMEYIISYAKDTFGCPVLFYTNPRYDSSSYQKMVDLLYEVKDKWGIEVIDLWNDTAFGQISAEEYREYMEDEIHPTLAGYEKWWLPVFMERL